MKPFSPIQDAAWELLASMTPKDREEVIGEAIASWQHVSDAVKQQLYESYQAR